MTSSSKQIKHRNTEKKLVFLKEQVEDTDLYKSVMNKIMTRTNNA